MKLFKLLLVVVCFVSSTAAQNDCKPYIPTESGASWELTSYNAKGKTLGRTTYEIIDKKVSGNTLTFTVKTTSYDPKDKEIFSGQYNAICENGVFKLNMTSLIDGSIMSQFRDMDMEVDASEYQLPDFKAPAGTTLEDGTLNIKLTGALGMNLNIEITDRKVDSHEEITTAAGTFDCIVLTQSIATKMVMNNKSTSKDWYAKNVGLVRSESYNKKGKLQSYTELTKLSQ